MTTKTTQVVNNITQNTNITIRPWSRLEGRLVIPVEMLRAAFTENKRLVEYCGLSDEDRTNHDTAMPYIVEAFIDLIKRAHAVGPEARNVYLNPNRADQAWVYDDPWKLVTVEEATRGAFDSVSDNLTRTIIRRMVPQDVLSGSVQNAAALLPAMYEERPDEYVEKARKPMAAHLANTAPARDAQGRHPPRPQAVGPSSP